MAETRDLLFELGTEELPPKSLLKLSGALKDNMAAGLEKAGLSYAAIEAYATPRRLALLIRELATAQPDQTVERRGPALNAAYDATGAPTKATEGFAKSCGVTVDQLITLKTDKGEWVGLIQEVRGKPTETLIPDIIRQSLAALPIAKRMRWGAGLAEFVRPVQWVVLIYGDGVIECEILGVAAGRTTRGHRCHAPAPIEITCPAEYARLLTTQGHVLPDFAERRSRIERHAVETAATVNGKPLIDPDLLDEITALVEWPVPVLGGFEARYLSLPPEVLITTMQDNQKYFPVVDADRKLLPHFITFSNIDSRRPEFVRQGNERVVRPRLADAEFFWNQDRKRTLEDRVEELGQVTFQNKLGSMLDKTRRVQHMAAFVAESLNVDPSFAERAALLAKADLLTHMVGEFTELQGTMGRYYALAEGEPEEVAQAIEEQYLPKVSGGPLPASRTGEILALAEKIDTLAGIFSIGLVPSGDRDPYALRRAALGVIRILIEKELDLDIEVLLEKALGRLPHGFDPDATRSALLDFLYERLRGYCLDQGYRHDEFEAVLAIRPTNLVDFVYRLLAVREFRALTAAESLAGANKRIRNILRKSGETVVANADEQILAEPSEKALLAAARQAHADILPLLHARDYTTALCRLAQLRDSVDTFFDEVMVMTEDESLRLNRLGLLALVEGLFLNIADISALQPAQ
ncbi:glycine--tRNA ligase subunit beta [Methylococcus geothermalis]|uniref:Glycine--tRNA ligase beta subunit n=1 Tax=Methylococcus geothermalis TaxID=2681310 RepID=A0A858Q7B3_9GAMM|nr:glycine--tRNA ligase subunit beta [Methylococcus geothermalis]QJD29720.1 glycine--tRNA ligase subunit beta [Methylococcus geothermalis]